MQSCGKQRKGKSEEGTKPRPLDRQAAGRDGDLRASRPPMPGQEKNSKEKMASSAAGLPPMGCGWGGTLRQEADNDASSSANAWGRRGNSPPARELHLASPAQQQIRVAGRDGALRASRPLSMNLLAKRRARVSAARNLGADFSLKARLVKVQNDRLQKAGTKAKRLKMQRRQG